MASNRQSSAGAFTLVEIMIVVAVIGLVAVLAIPSMIKARNSSLTQKCFQNQRLIYDGVVRYEMDYHRTLESIANNGVQVRDALVGGGYVNHQVGFDCPNSPVKDFDDYRLRYTGTDLTNVACTIIPTHVRP